MTNPIVKSPPHAIRLSAWRIAHLLCAVGISFMMMPFLIHQLGKHYYGIWILISVFSAYYGMVDLGLSTATQRYIAQAIGKGEADSINEIVSTALILYSILAVLVLGLGGAGYSIIPYVFHWEFSDIRLLQLCFLIMLGGLVLSFPLRSFTGMLGAALRQDLSAKLDILYVISKAAGTVAVVLKGKSLVYMALICVLVDILYYIIISYLVKRVYLTLQISINLSSVRMARKLFKYAFFSFVNRIAEILKFRLDSVVIASFVGVAAVSVYSVAFRLFEYFNEIVVSTIGFSDPYFSRYEGAREDEKLLAVFENFTKIATILSVFIGLSLVFYGKDFISCWIGSEFDESYAILPFLVIPGILMAIEDPLKRLFFAISRHYILAYISLAEGLANVILSLIFVRYYGLIGVAMGTAIPSLFISFFVIPVYGCAFLKMKVMDYWFKHVLVPAFLTTAFVLGYVMLIKTFLVPHFGVIAFFSVTQTCLFIPFAYFVFLKKSERATIVDLVQKKLGGTWSL